MATFFQRPPPKPGQTTYTIDLPGATDLFHFIIPLLNDKELKKERIERMRTKKSLVPEPLQWIPNVVTKIDDAQDLLTTALWLSKPLIRKLPTRFIPFIGWALTVSDIANLSTAILSLAMTPGLIKPELHKLNKKKRWTKKGMTQRVADFMKPGGWKRKLGDYIQAAQAAETVTGIGLTLGSVMGFLSDIMWAPYRIAMGDRVEIRLPPEKDLFNKAYRFISQAPQQAFAHDILSPEDHGLIIAAQNIAIGVISSSGVPINDERINQALTSRFPVMIPWEDSSIKALEESGFDLSRKNYYKPYIPKDNPTISDAIDLAVQSIPQYHLALKNEIGTGDQGSIFWLIGNESGMDAITFATGWTEDDIVAYSPEQRAALKMSEYNFMLTPPYTQKNLEEFMYVAMTLANTYGYIYPYIKDFINAAAALGLKWQKKY